MAAELAAGRLRRRSARGHDSWLQRWLFKPPGRSKPALPAKPSSPFACTAGRHRQPGHTGKGEREGEAALAAGVSSGRSQMFASRAWGCYTGQVCSRAAAEGLGVGLKAFVRRCGFWFLRKRPRPGNRSLPVNP